MKMWNGYFGAWLLLIGLLIMVAGCAQEDETSDRLTVFVSVLPQAYLAQAVGGPAVEVHTLVGPGHSPATYEPTPRQMAKLERASVYFRIGVPFEAAIIPKLAQTERGMVIEDMRQGIDLLPLEHHHHPGGHTEDCGGELDPHAWLDPAAASIMVGNVAAALAKIDAPRAESYRRRADSLKLELDDLDHEIRSFLAPLQGQKMYVYHPAYGYFAQAYGLVQVPVEIEGKEPGGRGLTGFLEQARADSVTTIFVQPQFSDAAVTTLAHELGASIVSLDPLAFDYFSGLRATAEAIATALSDQSAAGE